MAKLTLHVPEDLVVAAKEEAASREVSVSKLVSDFFRSLASESLPAIAGSELVLAPRTSRLAGCIPSGDLNDYTDYLEKKYS